MDRKNQTVVEMVRGLLKSGGLLIKFWREAVSMAIHLINRSPTQALHKKTPYEVRHGFKPVISYLKVFRCIAFALTLSQKLQKLDEKCEKYVFIGYSSESKTYRLYNTVSCKVIISKGWKKAMDAEIQSIISNNTWDLSELPVGKKVVGLKWIFKTKFNVQGSVAKLKARVVAKGYSQQHGVDFNEVFSLAAHLETVRLLLALATHSS